jgi:hypothetical protein
MFKSLHVMKVQRKSSKNKKEARIGLVGHFLTIDKIDFGVNEIALKC